MNPGDTGHVLLNRIPVPALNEGRGMNPGDTHPESSRPCAPRRALNEGRGMNPGDIRDCARPGRAASALNEGRGMNPGDTDLPRRGVGPGAVRSTKAGA